MGFEDYLRSLGYQSLMAGDDSSLRWWDPNRMGGEGERIYLDPTQLAALQYEFNKQNYLQPGQNFMLQERVPGLSINDEMSHSQYDAAQADYTNTQEFFNSQLPQGWQTREYGWDYQPGAIQTITLKDQNGNPITADVAPIGSKIIPQTGGGSLLDQAFEFVGNNPILVAGGVGGLAASAIGGQGFGLAGLFQGSEVGTALTDATRLAEQGLSPDAIKQVLEYSNYNLAPETLTTVANVASTVSPAVSAYSSVVDPINSGINSTLNQITSSVSDALKQILPDYQGVETAVVPPRTFGGGTVSSYDPDAALLAQQAGLPESYWNMTADAGASSVGQLGNNFNFSDTMSPDPFAEQAAPGFSYDLNIPSLDTYTGTGGNVGFFDEILNAFSGDGTTAPGFDANGNFSLGTGVTGDMSTVTNALGDPVTDRTLADILTGGGSNLGPLSDVLTTVGGGAVSAATAKTAYDYLKNIFGGQGSIADNVAGLLTSPVANGGGSLLAMAPSLAAINYAKNQSAFNTDPLTQVYNNAGNVGGTQFNTSNLQSLYNQNLGGNLDTSKLTDLYGQLQGNQSAYMNSLTNPYDQQTASGRGQLTQSLGQRGVLGSSFGAMDLANYDTTRDRGRADIVAQGMNNQIGQQANIAGALVNAQNQDRNFGLSAMNAKAGIANNILGAQQSQANLGLAGTALQNQAANNILNAQIKERELRNNLYGSALYALAGGLMPKNTFVLGR